MKFNKIFLPLAAVAALFGQSCTDEVEYVPAEAAPVTKYYFPTEQTYHTDLVDGDNKVTVSIARANSHGEETVSFNHTLDDGGVFNVPSSVTFADGVGVTTFDVTFDLADLEVDKEYHLTFTLPDIQDTPYSLGKLTISVLYLPWRDFEADNSMGVYTEGGFATLFGEKPISYPVKVQMHPTNDNIFRVVNPYGPGVWPMLDSFGDYDGEDHYMVIDCTNPNRVKVEEFFTGVTMNGFGPVSMISSGVLLEQLGNTPSAIENAGYYGTYDKGIIKNGSNAFWQVWVNNNGQEDWWQPKTNSFKLILPGFEDELEWEEYGLCDFTDGLLGPWFGILDNTYPVLVEHSLLDKDLYRIVNPYGENCGYFEDPDYLGEQYYTFSINDPDFVTIGTCEIGLYLNANKTMALMGVTSMADVCIDNNMMTPAEAKAAGYGAVYKDKVLTLSVDNCVGIVRNMATDRNSISQAPQGCAMVLDMSNPTPMNPEEEQNAPQNKRIGVQKVKGLKVTQLKNAKLNF